MDHENSQLTPVSADFTGSGAIAQGQSVAAVQDGELSKSRVDQVRILIRRGAYAEAATVGRALPEPLRNHPLVALQIVRAYMQQGDMQAAEVHLTALYFQSATPGEALILRLEAASLHIFRRAAFATALDAAQRALAEAADATLSPVERAEAERVHARIRLTAAIYYELNADQKQQTLTRLPVLADTLMTAGWVDEALAARLTYAEQLSAGEARLAALVEVAHLAEAAQRSAIAAEALVNHANLLVSQGAATALIEADLDQAAIFYAQANHCYGQSELDRVRAHLKIEREHVTPDALTAPLAAYQALNYHRGVLSILLDLSQWAHARGDIAAAIHYRQQLITLADQVGMGLLRDNQQLALIDLLIRHHNFGAAIEHALAALATNLPSFMAAGFEQLLATAYSFVSNVPDALHHARQALDRYEQLGVADSASNLALLIANYLDTLRQDAAWLEAEIWLQTWQQRDEVRKDLPAALSKSELRAQICINRYLYSPTTQGQRSLLVEADNLLSAALTLATQVQGIERIRRTGALHQLRAQVHYLRNDMAAVIETWRAALAIYEEGGLALETANCHYILGAFYLNLANQTLQPNFGEAETNLLSALDYYAAAYMRGQAADTRFMLARLYTNASLGGPNDLSAQLLAAALAHLSTAEADYDAIRREYAVSAVLEAQRGKRALIEKSRRIYNLALEIVTLHQRNDLEVWRWTQRAKARALTDALGTGTVTPARLLSALAAHPASLALVQQEHTLVAALEQAPPAELPDRRAALDTHYALMRQDPRLADYLELRHGLPLEPDDLAALIAWSGETQDTPVEPCVFIDWIAVEDRLFFIALRPGDQPYVERLATPVSVVQQFVTENLNDLSFRLTLRDHPEQLRALDALITPLALVSQPGDLLVLSPSGPLHALPLHALELSGTPLIARNPVVYTPSLSVLRHCVARSSAAPTLRAVALFGDPSDDTPNAVELVQQLAAFFATRQIPTATFLGGEVTHTTFAQAIPDQDLIYFHGHAVHDPTEPLASYLQLADGHFHAHEIFGMQHLNAELVILTACQSAASVIATGDEPLGLIPAFLYAGARAVLASQWRIRRPAAVRFMQHFLAALLDLSVDDNNANSSSAVNSTADAGQQTSAALHPRQTMSNKAKAVQQAMLTLRRDPEFSTPYYWAPFVLYGDWQ